MTGSRDWRGSDVIRDALSAVLSQYPSEPFTLVHGACPTGADRKAFDWALNMIERGFDVRIEPHPAKWDEFGKRAGFRRNAEMVKLGADLCLAFIQDESNGATHTKELAEKAGIETVEYKRSSTSMAGSSLATFIKEVQLDNVKIKWANFEGREEMYNAAGNRNFHVILPEDVALEMIAQGWNVKKREPREEGEEPHYHMKVKVSYKFKPPRITQVSKKWDRKTQAQKLMRTPLPEDLIGILDQSEFDTIDMIISPSKWNIRGESGVTAYLKTGFFFLYQDPLEERYASIPSTEDLPELEEGEGDVDWIDGEVVAEWDTTDQKELAA